MFKQDTEKALPNSRYMKRHMCKTRCTRKHQVATPQKPSDNRITTINQKHAHTAFNFWLRCVTPLQVADVVERETYKICTHIGDLSRGAESVGNKLPTLVR